MEGNRALSWRTSSYSGNNGGNCVEVAAPDAVLVRDTKDRDGGTLAFTRDAWAAFAARIRQQALP
jgi:hypothetical protein